MGLLHQRRAETALSPEKPESSSLRVMKLSSQAIIPPNGSRLAAGHDIYDLTDGLVPAKGHVIVETRIATRLLEGTY